MSATTVPVMRPSARRVAAASVSVSAQRLWRAAVIVTLGVLAVLAFAHLTRYPAMWFDEGAHLHVPKALVRYGVYADYSSEGFRFYGATMSVGPTVMLPIALAFEAIGMGLLQARLVMVVYMLIASALFYRVGRQLGSRWLALLALALLITSRGVDFAYYGRQVLGEVPGLAFLLGGIWCWFASWERAPGSRRRLLLAGLLFGLAVVTKYQYLIVLAPGLCLVWLVDRVYYRLLPFRATAWPLALTLVCFAGWQTLAVLYLGPAEASSNLRTMREAAAGAALSFSPEQMRRAFLAVVEPSVYSSLLLPALLFAAFRARERTLESCRWMAILAFIAVNLGWFVIASIGWPRYAFPAFALGAFAVARLACELFDAAWLPQARRTLASGAVGAAIVVTLGAPLALDLRDVLAPPPDNAARMAQQLNALVPPTALIETWEPEMGFLTDHRYHYPPQALLIRAVSHVWNGAPSPSAAYDLRQQGPPDYVLEGAFARWVALYPPSRLRDGYTLKTTVGDYALYERVAPHEAAPRGK
jgi:4-amino-4-deoxy-L-arabinose transferase-like glycosyltransferase